ncbi:hypothetical protein [Pseudooctadecabacter jejudonensis]|uniref:Uncharacterized protein n=1 Tax=Pseudooctadecabacter jejudonensis TaxID=1391910 RepID=A0A1Y5SMD2_9RHOB|nr:hypothetical protein [Pseudooctadecabacter jejudonensis]SLN40978.1 hypothetical protein PSJ8397_02047 [Pseudooctadecabacter jejudonensis]
MSADKSFYASRAHPESAGLSATLRHAGGWPALSITGSPQTVELTLVNRTPLPVTTGSATLRLQFRPGVLRDTDQIALAPESEAQWVLALEDVRPGKDVTLVMVGVSSFTLAPGAALTVRLDGISAAPEGGSRATNVDLSYSDFFHPSGTEVAGARLIHLPVLRRHAPASPPIKDIRTGAVALSGPFSAGFVGGNQVVNDGFTLNTLTLRIVNTARHSVPLAATSEVGDGATEIHLGFRAGKLGAQWGLVSERGDHVGIASVTDFRAADDHSQPHGGWQVDNHTLRRVSPGTLEPGDYVEIVIEVQTQAEPGQAQLILTYENLRHSDDGDLVLLATLGSVVDSTDGVTIARALTVEAPITGADFASQSHQAMSLTPQTFTVGGDIDAFYPVVFEDLDWMNSAFKFQIMRPYTHIDSDWHGTLMAEVSCHSSNYGHGSEFARIRVAQAGRIFLAGFANYHRRPYHVAWLRGATTYKWRSQGPGLLSPLNNLTVPGPLTITFGDHGGDSTYDVKTSPDPEFDKFYVKFEYEPG